MKSISIGIRAAAVFFFVTSSAVAAINTPPGLQPGDKFHLVFVTSGTTQAVTSNPPTNHYDLMVFTEAQNAGLLQYHNQFVDWYALGSFNMDASALQRFNPLSPAYRLDGAKVANNGVDLWDGTIQNPITVAPDLTTVEQFVWTGSNTDGTHSSSPIGNGFNPVRIGVSFSNSSIWINATDFPWETQLHLYAFSSELTAIPEPGTSSLFVCSIVGLLGRCRSRRRGT